MTLLRKGILVSGGQFVIMPMTIITGIIFSRALGPDGMGQYELFRTTSTLVAALLTLGLGSANIYFLNNRKIAAERIVTNSVKAGVLLGLVLVTVLTTVVLTCQDYFGTITVATGVLFASGTAALMLTAMLRPVLAAQLAARRMVSVDFSSRIVLLTGGAALAAFHLISADAAIRLLAFGQASALLLVLHYLRDDIRLSHRFEWDLFGQVVVYGLKLAAVNLLFLLSSQLTVMLLRYLRPDAFGDVGLYTRAAAVGGLVTLVPVAVSPLLFAQWSTLSGEARTRQMELAARLYLCYGLSAWLGIALFGRWVIWILYGDEFLPANAALQVLAPALTLVPLFGVCNTALAGDGRALISTYILLCSVTVVAVVTSVAVPQLGIRGAAFGVLCGNICTAVLGLLICTRLYHIRLAHCLIPRVGDVRYVQQALFGRRGS